MFKILRKNIFKVLTGIKFNNFKRKSINTLSYASTRIQRCLSFLGHQLDITLHLMTMKTTSKQKRKIQ